MWGRLGALFEVMRPRTLARAERAVDRLDTSARELKREAKELAAAQRRVEVRISPILEHLCGLDEALRSLQQQVGVLVVRESQLRAIMLADAQRMCALDGLPSVLDEGRIAQHVTAAIAHADLRLDPFPYVIVKDLFPDDFYEALVSGIPPIEMFGDSPINEQQLRVPLEVAPLYSRRVWNFAVYRVVQRIIQPAVVRKFRGPLEAWISRHWPQLAADPLGPPVKFHASEGRIMRRGRGYYISPHRDPKWGFLTCLWYLVREGDSEAWGTQLFVVDDDEPAPGTWPHWIDERRCRVAVDVPFRRNSMLVLLNSAGAHGARIPDDAVPANLERYIYQYRIGPTPDAIRNLLSMLPEDQQRLWAGKVDDGAHR